MKVKLSDNKIILILVVALIAQVLVLLWHLGILQIGAGEADLQQGALAGHIERVENSLKRRPLDSLIWEDSQKKENIYFHDSILTLAQSTAQLKLENGTQIQLSENTLITIEPPGEQHSNEIRIKFSQGNLKARNPYQAATIQDKDLTINLKANSDIELYKSEGDKIEIQVNKGEVEFTRADKTVHLNENDILRVDKDESAKVQITNELRWTNPPALRQYTHSKDVIVPLQWTGSAQKLIVSSPGEIEQSFTLAGDQQTFSTSLAVGEHRIILVADDKVSQPMNIQVWKAPIIHLVTPQPRNRVNPGRVPFVWTANKNMKSYTLRVLSSTSHHDHSAVDNAVEPVLNQEGDMHWGIWAEDQEGFMVPPAYQYPLFIRSNLFEAPQLNKPQLLKPKTELPPPTSMQWPSLLFSPAWAAHKEELVALFSWQAITGAEIYMVEIATSQDFRNPLLQTQVNKNQFLWRNFDPKKKYYWRVAAGDLSGRLGMFTEPTLIEMIEAKQVAELIAAENPKPPEPVAVIDKPKPLAKPVAKKKPIVQQAPIKPPPAAPPPVAVIEHKPEPEIKKPEVEEKSVDVQPEIKREPAAVKKPIPKALAFQLWWQPGSSSKELQSPLNTEASLQGLQMQSFGLQLDVRLSTKRQLKSILQYSSVKYEPEPRSRYPLQKDIQLAAGNGRLFLKHVDSPFGFGGQLLMLPQVEKKSIGRVDSSSLTAYGLLMAVDTRLLFFDSLTTLGLLYGDEQVGGQVAQRLLIRIAYGVFVGAEIQHTQLKSSTHSTQITDSSAIVGIGF